MKNKNITAYYLGAAPKEFTGSFKKAVTQILEEDIQSNKTPLYIELEGIKFLYERGIYNSFVKGDITYKDFIFQFTIDRVVRNKKTMVIYGNEVEPLSLWWCKADQCHLADADRYVESQYIEELFTPVIPGEAECQN